MGGVSGPIQLRAKGPLFSSLCATVPNMTPLRILLIEDAQSTVDLIRESLSESDLDAELHVASNGEAALEVLQQGIFSPQLILLDLNLPGKSGLDVLKEVKRDRALRAIPVVVWTNSQSPDDVVRAYAAHCNAYVRKPLEFDELTGVLQEAGKFWFEIATLPDLRDGDLKSTPLSIPPKLAPPEGLEPST